MDRRRASGVHPLHAVSVTPAISPGETHSLILKTDSTVRPAGSNDNGQLGLPIADKAAPVKVLLPPVPVPTPWQQAQLGDEATNPDIAG